MTETEILTTLARDAERLKNAIEVAGGHEYRDRADIAEMVAQIKAVRKSIDMLTEIEPRLGG